MATYSVEVTYYVPTYIHVNIEADTPEAAARAALEKLQAENLWSQFKPDLETSSRNFVTGIWEGEDSAYNGDPVPLPESLERPQTDWF